MSEAWPEGESTWDEKVYFIQMLDASGFDGPVKIGRTTRRVQTRRSNLQTGSPHPLRVLAIVPGGREVESMFHRDFSEEWIQGEWFRLSPRLLKFLLDYRGILEGLVGGPVDFESD